MLRFLRIEEKEYHSPYLDAFERTLERENIFGIGLEIGFRYFTSSGFYYGASASFGNYLVGAYSGDLKILFYDTDFLFDIEFFRIGYAF